MACRAMRTVTANQLGGVVLLDVVVNQDGLVEIDVA